MSLYLPLPATCFYEFSIIFISISTFIFKDVYVYIYMSVYIYRYLHICMYLSPSMYVCLSPSIYLSLYLSLYLDLCCLCINIRMCYIRIYNRCIRKTSAPTSQVVPEALRSKDPKRGPSATHPQSQGPERAFKSM